MAAAAAFANTVDVACVTEADMLEVAVVLMSDEFLDEEAFMEKEEGGCRKGTDIDEGFVPPRV